MRSHRKSRSFFRIILSDNQSSLEIPKRFTREHRKQILLNNVRLIVDDKVWPLGWMISDDGKLWLQRGWPEFIEHYCIEVGYLLLFNYLGKSVFHVSIFDRSCGEINYLTPSKSPKSWKRKDRSVIQEMEGTRKSGRVAINTSLSHFKNTLDHPVGIDDDDDFTNPIAGMNMLNTRKANKQSIEGTRKSGRVSINTSLSRFKNTPDDPVGVDDDDSTNPIAGMNMLNTRKVNKQSIEGTRKSGRVAINTSLSRIENTPGDPVGVDDDDDFTNPIAGINMSNTRKANKQIIEGTRKSERVAINTSLSRFKNTPDEPIGVDDDEDFTNPIAGINMPNTRKANKESIEGTRKSGRVAINTSLSCFKNTPDDPVSVDDDDDFTNPIEGMNMPNTRKANKESIEGTRKSGRVAINTSLSRFKNTLDDPVSVDDDDDDFTNPIKGMNMPNTRKANKESIEGTKKKEQVKKRKVVKKQKMVVVDDEDDTFQNPSSRSTLRIDAQTLDQNTEERTQMVVSTEGMDEAANNESVKTHETMHSEEVLENMEEIEVITRKGRKRKAVEKGENESQKKTKRKYYSILTRTSPKTLYRAIRTLSPKQQAKVIEMGFGSLLKMKLDGIPSRLGYFVVDKYNPVGCELRTDKGHIEITKETIHDMIGAPVGGIRLESLPTTESGLAIARRWREQFPKKDIRPGDVLIQMTKSKDVDINFMLNFIVIFCNTMAKVKGNGFCDIEFVPKINEAIDVANIDWCAYIFESLVSCKNTWKGKGADSYFCGALTMLTLHYVDSVRCKGFEVKRQRPAIQGWSMELLKVREEAEIENGGFGLGDFNPPYQEDETQTIEGMLEKLEGILQNHLELKESSDMILSWAYEKYPDCPDFKLWEQKVRMVLCEKDDNVAEGISEGSDVQDQTRMKVSVYNNNI